LSLYLAWPAGSVHVERSVLRDVMKVVLTDSRAASCSLKVWRDVVESRIACMAAVAMSVEEFVLQ
jgi:hypothetical protein